MSCEPRGHRGTRSSLTRTLVVETARGARCSKAGLCRFQRDVKFGFRTSRRGGRRCRRKDLTEASRHMFGVLGLGFLLGMQHALEADHIAAVSSIAARRTDIGDIVKHGLTWGLGHTLTSVSYTHLRAHETRHD